MNQECVLFQSPFQCVARFTTCDDVAELILAISAIDAINTILMDSWYILLATIEAVICNDCVERRFVKDHDSPSQIHVVLVRFFRRGIGKAIRKSLMLCYQASVRSNMTTNSDKGLIGVIQLHE
jgi:hypothetical protein